MKAKLIRVYSLRDSNGGLRKYRLLTAGTKSDAYIDYYILQSHALDELGGDRWTTIIDLKVSERSQAPGFDDWELLLFQLLHGVGVVEVREG